MKQDDKVISEFGSDLGTIITQQALQIAKYKVLLEETQSENAELKLQVQALRKKDNQNGGSSAKHK